MKKVTYWMCVYLFTFLPFISLSAQNGENLKKKEFHLQPNEEDDTR